MRIITFKDNTIVTIINNHYKIIKGQVIISEFSSTTNSYDHILNKLENRYGNIIKNSYIH